VSVTTGAAGDAERDIAMAYAGFEVELPATSLVPRSLLMTFATNVVLDMTNAAIPF
jgi:hypothetical protein